MIFSLIFSDLKLGIFHQNILEKKRFGIGNITVKRPKKTIVEIYETDYNHVQIWELEKLQIFYLNSAILL